MHNFKIGQDVYVKIPPTKGIDDNCWHQGTVLAITAKRVKVFYDNGHPRTVYQLPKNIREI